MADDVFTLDEVMSGPFEESDTFTLDEVMNTFEYEIPRQDDLRDLGVGANLVEGAVEAFASAPQIAGTFLMAFGDYVRKEKPTTIFGTKPLIDPRPLAQRIYEAGENISKSNEEYIRKKFPEQGNLTFADKFARGVGQGAVSLATAIGMGAVAGPSAPALAFGLSSGAGGFVEAGQKGYGLEESIKIGSALGFAEGSLEYIGVKRLLALRGGSIRRLVSNAVNGAFTEFAQEAMQTGAEGTIKTATGLREYKGVETIKEIAKESLFSGAVGAVLGGGAGVSLSMAQKKAVERSLVEAGVDPKKAGPLADQLMKDAIEDTTTAVETLPELGGDDVSREVMEAPVTEEEEAEASDLLARLDQDLAEENRIREEKGLKISAFEKKAQKWVKENPVEFLRRYRKRIKEEFPGSADNVVSADAAKFAIPGMEAARSADYHEAGSALAKHIFEKLLNDPNTMNKEVLFTAGGSGAGKSHGLANAQYPLSDYAIIYDTNLDDLAKARKKLNQVKKTGRFTTVQYTHRDPVKAFEFGVIPRIKKQNRTVPIPIHIKTNLGAFKTFMYMATHREEFSVNDFDFIAIDNTGGKNDAMYDVPLDSLEKFDYTYSGLKNILLQKAKEALERGDITDEQYRITIGSEETQGMEPKELRKEVQRGPQEGGVQPTEGFEGIEEVDWDEEVTPQQIKPKKGISALDQKLQDIKDKARSVEFAKEALAHIKTIQKDLLRRIAPHKDGQLKEEYKEIPNKYKNKKGITPDQIASELGISENELVDYLKDLDSQAERLKDDIADNKPKILEIRISEAKQLRDRLRDVMLGESRGRQQTKEQIKAYQQELTDTIKDLEIPAKDKAKFLSTIKEANTAYMLNKKVSDVLARADKYAQAEKKRVAKEKIKRELKYTKPVAGKGKYDYQSNKLFKELRDIFKLSGKAAQDMLADMEEDLSEEGLIKRRLVSFKANGASGSVELHDQVLADIKRLKYLGSISKNEEAFIEKVGRQVAVEEMSEGVSKIKADKKTLKTQIGNLYRKGFSNIYSMINSIAGKQVAESLDPEIHENAKDIAIFKETRRLTNKIAKILGLQHADDVIQEFQDRSEEVYTLVDREGLVTEISKMQIMDIYNSIKNDLVRERYENAFGEEQIDAILGELTANEMLIADIMMESVQSYREVLNKRAVETTGMDLGIVDNYWPASSEYAPDLLDDYKTQGETPSAMKERSKSSRIFPVPKNAWEKVTRHIAQAEHVDKLSRQFVDLKRIFSNRRIKNQIENKFGKDVYRTLMDQIENISLNRVTERGDFVSGVMGKAVNNWVTAKIAVNPSVFVKQLGSVINYAENMPMGDWSVGFAKGLASPKETFQWMWENSDGFLEARFNRGFSEAMTQALKGASMINKNKNNWAKGLSSLVRSGDISAIIYGGFPFVQHQIQLNKAKGMSDKAAMKAAFKAFKVSTLKSQQSGLSSGLSQFQNKTGAAWRLFLAFKNTSNQYFRKQVDAIMQYQNGDISAKQLAKMTTIYSIINPMVFAGSGVLVKGAIKGIGSLFGAYHDDDEDFQEEITSAMLMQILISPFQAVPVFDDMANFAARRAFDKPAYQVFSTPMLDDLATAMQKLTKDDISLLDYLDSFGTLAEVGLGAPVKTGVRLTNYLIGD